MAELMRCFVEGKTKMKRLGLKQAMKTCPMCKKKDALRFNISSYNGHGHMYCTTDGCNVMVRE